MALRHDTTHPRSALWGAAHTTGTESEGDILQYIGGEWVAIAGDAAGVGASEVLMVTGISNPPEPLLNSAGDDWMYSS